MVSIIRLVFRAFSSGPRKVKHIAASPVKVIDTSQKDTEHPLAKVLQVIDGDTVDVKKRGNRIRIRLDSIDCPEDGQPWGDTAKAGLIKMIGGKSVHLEEHGYDEYGRTIATVFVRDDQKAKWINVNERMVTLGHAWVMRAYYAHLPEDRRRQLNRLETWAKSKRVGLWGTPNPTPPWEWRREK
jgi:endonuclease YncB( thermonuclease family)